MNTSPPPQPPLKVPAPQLQAGGARITADGTVNAPDVLLGVILVIGIAQAHQFPEEVFRFTDTLLGRTLLFALAIAFTAWKGWTIGLLFALFAARLLQHTGRAEQMTSERFEARMQEAFSNGDAPDDSVFPLSFNDGMTIQPVSKKKHKWFIERVLKENPLRIETDKVRTQAVQGN